MTKCVSVVCFDCHHKSPVWKNQHWVNNNDIDTIFFDDSLFLHKTDKHLIIEEKYELYASHA